MKRSRHAALARVTKRLTHHVGGTSQVRGIENSAVTLGELELPPSARLKVHRVNTNLSSGELVTLAQAPSGTSGALVGMCGACDSAMSNRPISMF